MSLVFEIFGLFIWYKLSWALSSFLSYRIMQKRLMVIHMRLEMLKYSARAQSELKWRHAGVMMAPIVIRLLLFAALLWLCAYYVVEWKLLAGLCQ